MSYPFHETRRLPGCLSESSGCISFVSRHLRVIHAGRPSWQSRHDDTVGPTRGKCRIGEMDT